MVKDSMPRRYVVAAAAGALGVVFLVVLVCAAAVALAWYGAARGGPVPAQAAPVLAAPADDDAQPRVYRNADALHKAMSIEAAKGR